MTVSCVFYGILRRRSVLCITKYLPITWIITAEMRAMYDWAFEGRFGSWNRLFASGVDVLRSPVGRSEDPCIMSEIGAQNVHTYSTKSGYKCQREAC